jgi:hypothetical protein
LGRTYQCGDCRDNDEDGVADARDPDCLGPCDNTEDTLDAGFANSGKCGLDCYFDRDGGQGNDGCLWDRRCDSLAGSDLECSDAPLNCGAVSKQSDQCRTRCQPLVPNGCDCFGCCTFDGRSVYVGTLKDGKPVCTREALNDPALCAPCRPVADCQNPCTGCEVCVGEVAPPANCGGTSIRCSTGVKACRDHSDCGSLAYCLTGCCVDTPR